MVALCTECGKAVFGEDNFEVRKVTSSGSTDMGDLCNIMPVVHPYVGGAKGKGHGNDYEIYDPENACVKNAEWQLVMLTKLLENGGERAENILENFTPRFASKEEFLAYQDSLACSGDRITYREDGTAEVRL